MVNKFCRWFATSKKNMQINDLHELRIRPKECKSRFKVVLRYELYVLVA